jgi:hypothetical protein
MPVFCAKIEESPAKKKRPDSIMESGRFTI